MNPEPLRYVGPCEIECPNRCEVPAGAAMVLMPRPRHAWGDMVHCPHADDGCEASFLVETTPNQRASAGPS